MNENWILQLFTEPHWKQKQPLSTQNSTFSRLAFLENEPVEDQIGASIKRKTYQMMSRLKWAKEKESVSPMFAKLRAQEF
ncbi:hypothetical protein N7519_007152 [Penicillium mononematosum]|uniref:uncharacterized protein n=1 Tax=Penicillium mononematosum TaxID=268346 RepID=UPI002546C0A2|nr:uncharacterized protein N7519_007152 [Penicillium mononematosum]KAJ6185851.1 hypothetical protein N7519_007152 [Penicillium mononematosum]